MVYKCINNIHSRLFPPTCVFCGLAGHEALDVCASCLSELPFNRIACHQCSLPLMTESDSGICGHCQNKSPFYHSAFSLFIYAPPISNLIQAIKYQRKIQYTRLLGELMAGALYDRPETALPELIIPVPLHPSRQRKRGFNQAIELARPIAKKIGLPVVNNMVIRNYNTQPQAELNAQLRQSNVRGIFTLAGKPDFSRIALLDDVVTTGSTVNELARVLRRAGVKTIEVWSVARADYR